MNDFFTKEKMARKKCDDRPLRAPNTTTSFPRSRNFPVPSRSSFVVPGTLFPCCKKESTPQVHCIRSLQMQVFRPSLMPRPSLFIWARRTSAKNANTTTLRSIECLSGSIVISRQWPLKPFRRDATATTRKPFEWKIFERNGRIRIESRMKIWNGSFVCSHLFYMHLESFMSF